VEIIAIVSFIGVLLVGVICHNKFSQE